ncbi:hypothetical protein FA15DRAFT_718211 [Coprinopsis marcescibilis]|uniref:Uncharacterized protein n=1 Tax=Coprinopsis marcescibilis TaxID=230819 RepID=A0A5C3KMG4_COPMA|nr:hypothetical protein FA15DRAFT_718211 [Coprinopsis marcescibilis]
MGLAKLTDEESRPLKIALLASILLLAVVFGIHLFIFVEVLLNFLRSSQEARRTQRVYTVVSFTIFVAFIVFTLARNLDVGSMLVDKLTFLEAVRKIGVNPAVWRTVVEQLAGGLIQIVGEGMMIQLFRCFIIWDHRRAVIVLPAILYVSTAVMGLSAVIMDHIQAMNTTGVVENPTANEMGLWLAYFVLSIGVNFLHTSLIAYPIIRMRYQMRKLDAETSFKVLPSHLEPYTRVLSIIIESAFPFTISGSLAVIISVNKSSAATLAAACAALPMSNVVWTSTASLAPHLIIYRVARGRSWTRNPATDWVILSQQLSSSHLGTKLERKNDFNFSVMVEPQSAHVSGRDMEWGRCRPISTASEP